MCQKSCGPDAIHCRLMRLFLSSGLAKILSQLFKLCILSGLTPTRWNHSSIALLAKKPESKTIEQFRPISLTAMTRRLFERCLLPWLEQPWAKFSRIQSGFRRRRSTLTAALLVDEAMKRKCRIMVLLDFANAYDSVHHSLLLQRLLDRGASQQELSLIHSLMMRGRTASIIVNQSMLSPIPLKRGLQQGSVLSPLLFNVYIDSLARLLDSEDSAIPTSSLYADDVATGAHDYSVVCAKVELVSKWCVDNDIEIKTSKCIVVGLNATEPDIIVNEQPIPRATDSTSVQYVGFDLDKQGIRWDTTAIRLAAKAEKILTASR